MEHGVSYELVYTVVESDLASKVGVESDDVFPPVLATSRLIGLMEVSSARLLRPLLEEGQLSVGVGVQMKHFAPTPVDEEIRIVATYDGVEDKLHQCKVEAYDRAGKVASCKHTRAIVDPDRIVAGARSRMEKAEAESS